MDDSIPSVSKVPTAEDAIIARSPEAEDQSEHGSRASTALAGDDDKDRSSSRADGQLEPSSPISTQDGHFVNKTIDDATSGKIQEQEDNVYYDHNFSDSHFYDVDLENLTPADRTVVVNNGLMDRSHVEITLTEQTQPDEPTPEQKDPVESLFKKVRATFKTLVDLMTTMEKVLFFIGILSALLLGLVAPYVIYSFGKLVAAFVVHAQLVSRIPLVFSNNTTASLNATTPGTILTSFSTDIVFNTSEKIGNDSIYHVTTNMGTTSSQLPTVPTSTVSTPTATSSIVLPQFTDKIPINGTVSYVPFTGVVNPADNPTTPRDNPIGLPIAPKDGFTDGNSPTTNNPFNGFPVSPSINPVSDNPFVSTDNPIFINSFLTTNNPNNVLSIMPVNNPFTATPFVSTIPSKLFPDGPTENPSIGIPISFTNNPNDGFPVRPTDHPHNELPTHVPNDLSTLTPGRIISNTGSPPPPVQKTTTHGGILHPPDVFNTLNETLQRVRREVDVERTTEAPLPPPEEPQKSPQELKKVEDLLYVKATSFALRMAILGLTSFVVGFLMVVCLSVATESFMFRFRQNLLKTVLHRDLTWFEQQEKEQLQTLMATGMNKFHNVLGENLGQLICLSTTVLACSIEAFIYGWKLAFVLFSLLPCYAIAAWFYAKIEYVCTITQQEEFSKAEVTATQTLKEMKTVMAFGGEQKESLRYNTVVRAVRMAGQKRGWKCGLILAGVCLFKHLAFAVGFWFGMHLVLEGMESGEMDYTTTELYIVLFSALVAAITSGQLIPYADGLRQATPWVQLSLRMLRMNSAIDSSSSEGIQPKRCSGRVSFKDVHFSYPSQPDTEVLSGFNLEVEAGESVAIVGIARGGKSTILQLLQRFYDPSSGTITVDDHDLRGLKVGWLRQQVSLVEASPVLFSTTIRENIRYGRQDAPPEDIVAAACTANAHEFIMKLPQQYDTIVGEHGTILTDSKKQRVAIARALVRDPHILLLDGATTQMDIQQDRVVLAALEKARSSRTTIIVPHKLSSIMHIKHIVVISEGKVVESGTHTELMEKNGIYCDMFMEEAIHEKPDVPDWDDEEDYVNASATQEVPREAFCNRLTPMHRIRIHKNSDWLDVSKFKIRPTLLRLFRMSRPFSTFCLMGLLSSASYGLLFVIFTVILGHFIGVLAEKPENYADKAEKYAWDALILGVFSALFTFLQNSMFAFYGERLSNRLRKHLFQAMLGQEMSWFDDPSNTTRALCVRLAVDPAHIQEAATTSVGQLVQIATTTAACTLITVYYSWKIAIVAATFTSIAVFITCLQTKVNTADSSLQTSALEVAGKIASESLHNIRTLASLHAENVICSQHRTALLRLHNLSVDIFSIRGLLFGITRCTPLLLYSAVNSLGGFLIMFEGYSQQRVIVLQQVTETAFFAIVQAVPLIYISIRALEAAHRMFQLLDRKPAIDSSISAGFMLPIRGNRSINFEGVEFGYVSKRLDPAVEKLTFDITEGKTTAIVGPSGSGKSTCIYLIERLYDPKEGSVVLDNIDLQNLNVPWLRSQLAIVTKDSLLAHQTISENIAYGDNMRHVRVDEILQACRKVYLDTVVSSLPKGYDTIISEHPLTPLQKFQIASARALVRKPRVVLIDDLFFPSSCEDQQILQNIISQLQEGRTCLITSHCLKAVRAFADHFVVLNTKMVERGSHQELMDLQGQYFRQWHRENVKLRRASEVRVSRRHSLQGTYGARLLPQPQDELKTRSLSRQKSVA